MRARAAHLANLAFWVLVVVATLRYVLPKWREFGLSSRLSSLEPAWIAGAMLVFALQFVALFFLWCVILWMLKGRAPIPSLFRAFCLSLLPKYVPGKLLGPGLRTRLTAGAGVSYPVAVGSLVWEVCFALSSSALITILGLVLGVSRDLEPTARWLLLAFPLVLIAGLVALRIPRLRGVAETWMHIGAALQNRPGVASLVVGYVCTWGLYTTAHWMVARAIMPFPAAQIFPLLVALAASWLIGFMSVFAPAGLGVREGALFIFARGPMGVPSALLFVTLSRLVIFVVEATLTVLAALMPAPSAARSSDVTASTTVND